MSRASSSPALAPIRGQRVLFVEQFYYPDGWGGAELPLDITVRLAQKGFDVEVVCGSDVYAPLDGEPPADPRREGVRIRRVPAFILRSRIARQAWFCALLAPLLFLRRPPDLLVAQTNPPPALVLLALAARLRRRPLLLIAMDVYPEVLTAHGMMRPDSMGARLLRRAFNWAYRGASTVVSLGPAMSARLESKGIGAERIVEIPNWATGRPGRVTDRSNALRSEWGLEGKFVLLYSGNLGVAHEFTTLLRGVERAHRTLPELRMVFVGRGNRVAEARALARDLQIESVVRFSDLLPPERLPESFGLAHLAVVTLQPGFEGLVVPSKLQGYLARGLPVLYIGPPGDVDRFMADTPCGICKSCGDVDGVSSALIELARDPARLAELGDGARRLYDAKFGRERGLVRYEAIVTSLLARGRASP